MLCIGIEFLTGVAYLDRQAYDEPGQPEWPPHPDRLFMALVAAAYRREPEGDELDALRWLESAGPPSIKASKSHDRPTVEAYWPTNDRLVANRNKAKLLASTCPDDPCVVFCWNTAPPPPIRAGLESITKRVTHVGASESIVSCWLDDEYQPANWLPAEQPTAYFRVPSAGRLKELEMSYAGGLKPVPAGWSGYRQVGIADDPVQGEWSSVVPLGLSRPMDLRDVVGLVEATRRCVLQVCPDPIPEWVSGHTPDGDRVRASHMAIVPLANVGHEHANGLVYGMGLLIPKSINPSKRNEALGGLFVEPQWIDQKTSLGQIETPRRTTSTDTWTTAARCWGTVTPIALHRWPKQESVEEILLAAIRHAELPPPQSVEILRVSPHRGGLGLDLVSPPNRYRMHAIIEWDGEISGPVAIGAGRYKGLGWCKAI